MDATPLPATAPWARLRPWRDNNPGDLRCLAGNEKWAGQTGVDTAPGGPFAIFTSRMMGWRALAVCLLTYYEAHHLNTVEAIICRYAPALENDTGGYIALVCSQLKVHRLDIIEPRNPPVMLALVSAIALAEGGARIPWPADEKLAGVNLALGIAPPADTTGRTSVRPSLPKDTNMTFAELIAAAEHGAASIYHAVLETGAEITSWETNPVVAPLLTAGAAVANAALARAGVAPGTLAVVEADVATGLKTIAAADPTVPSVGGISKLLGLAGTIASTVDPAIAPAVATAVNAGTVAEDLVAGVVARPAAATPA